MDKFLESSTSSLLSNPSIPISTLITSADHAFEFEHWPDAFFLYSEVESRASVEGAPQNGHVFYRVGVMYERGNYVTKNPRMAKKYFEMALKYLQPICDIDPEARCDLAYMLENGYGVPEDKKKAVEYYRIAAQQGYPRAQVNLGYMYSNAYGVECDKAQAVKYYQMAADQGYTNAYTNLGYMYSNGYGIPQDKFMAVKYYRKAAERGYARGLCNLGYMFDYGYGVSQSKKEAAYYYQLAANQGYSVAQCNLAYMYEHGLGVNGDKKVAVYYYQLAAQQSYPRALCNLAEMYAVGDEEAGIKADSKKAIQYFILAADQDYERAKGHIEAICDGIYNIDSSIWMQLTIEALADNWPSLTMVNNTFKNNTIQNQMEYIFNGRKGYQQFRDIAVLNLLKEWPSKRAQMIVSPKCKKVMIELLLVLRNEIGLPNDLYPLIVLAVIGFWPTHFEPHKKESDQEQVQDQTIETL